MNKNKHISNQTVVPAALLGAWCEQFHKAGVGVTKVENFRVGMVSDQQINFGAGKYLADMCRQGDAVVMIKVPDEHARDEVRQKLCNDGMRLTGLEYGEATKPDSDNLARVRLLTRVEGLSH